MDAILSNLAKEVDIPFTTTASFEENLTKLSLTFFKKMPFAEFILVN